MATLPKPRGFQGASTFIAMSDGGVLAYRRIGVAIMWPRTLLPARLFTFNQARDKRI